MNSQMANELELELIYLVLMSNPEASWWKDGRMDGLPLFAWYARETRGLSHGAVVGTTPHVTDEDLAVLRHHLDEECVILAPGIGSQGGNLERLTHAFGRRVLFSASRAISHAESPGHKASELVSVIRKVLSVT